jgi:voltage-gated potassium channel Kch
MTKGLKPKVKIAVWLTSIATVIAVGLFYFPRENPDARFWQTLYFTLRLFVFEHDSATFPKSWPLIFIYFLAPVITISAVGTVISYLFRLPPAIKTRWMSDHVVICGMGRTGKLFASALKEKGVQVVGVDLGPPEDFDEWCDQHRVPMIFGDFNSRALLQKMGAAKARSIIFASGDDLANLEGALSAYEWLQTNEGPIRLIWAQIANDELANTARAAVRTSGKVGIRFFDTYRMAAVRIIAKYFNRNLQKEIREVNILGFGKFGHDILDVLVNELHSDEKFNIRVIDMQDREGAVRSLAEELGVAERVTFQKTAVQDLLLGGEVEKAYFVCTDDDLGNLTAAMSLACDVKATRIYVRMDHWPLSGVAENLGGDRGVFFININNLVVQEIDDLPGIFEPAQASDLKRAKLGTSSM